MNYVEAQAALQSAPLSDTLKVAFFLLIFYAFSNMILARLFLKCVRESRYSTQRNLGTFLTICFLIFGILLTFVLHHRYFE